MLTPTLKQPSDLFNKLRREQHRAFHAQHPTHVADHLYNFCVTTLALRDHVFQALELDNKAQAGFHQLWNASPVRVASSPEIRLHQKP